MTFGRVSAAASILVFLFIGKGATTAQQVPFLDAPMGVIKGKVLGVNLAKGMADVKVRIESETLNRNVITDKDGSFEVALPAGVYTVTANVPDYYPYRRAPFRVFPGKATRINLQLFLVSDAWVERYYEKLVPPDATEDQLDLLVEYRKRKEHGNLVEYEGARLYYDALAVSAISIVLDKRDFSFRATGNVRIDKDQQSEIYVKQTDIHFNNGVPDVRMQLGAIDYVSGKGSIEGGNVTFEFSIMKDQTGKFSYEDKELGISLIADIVSFRVVNDDAGEVQFTGTASIAPDREAVAGRGQYTLPATFIVTVQDKGGNGIDLFSISVDPWPKLNRSGLLSNGNIRIHRAY